MEKQEQNATMQSEVENKWNKKRGKKPKIERFKSLKDKKMKHTMSNENETTPKPLKTFRQPKSAIKIDLYREENVTHQ